MFRAGAPDPVQSLICLLTSLLKSFPRPLLESGVGPFARYGNHQEIIYRRLAQMYTSSDTRLEWPKEGPLLESHSNKHRGPKTGQLFASAPRPLLSQACSPWAEMAGTHQETTSRKHEQMYTPSDTRLEWLGEEPLSKSDSN